MNVYIQVLTRDSARRIIKIFYLTLIQWMEIWTSTPSPFPSLMATSQLRQNTIILLKHGI